VEHQFDAPALVGSSIDPVIADLISRAREFAAASLAPNSRRAYEADLRHYRLWCQIRSVEAVPAAPQTIALYLASLSEKSKASTIQRRLSAISRAHRDAMVDTPTSHPAVRKVMAGIRRVKGTAANAKAALMSGSLRRICAAMPSTILGIRDRALLLLGFVGALRRSELVSLNREDLNFEERGIVVRLNRSKTDQDGISRGIGIPRGRYPETCAVRSVETWLGAANIRSGALFRPINRHGVVLQRRLTDKAVARIVKRSAQLVGIDSNTVAGHSLRSGMATSAAAAGASERSIMTQTGHRSEAMVRRYIRHGSIWIENAASVLDL
jgi:site-specific recombinase XerD